MAKFELVMPKMGESIMEATILQWLKKVGDEITEDESIIEIATDKVDSEIPSPVSGKLSSILFKENDVVAVGTVIAHIEVEGESVSETPEEVKVEVQQEVTKPEESPSPQQYTAVSNGNGSPVQILATAIASNGSAKQKSDRFYSPLVKNIAKREQISYEELDALPGSGANGRLTKKDILTYIENRQSQSSIQQNFQTQTAEIKSKSAQVQVSQKQQTKANSQKGNHEIIEMDRMRRMIADHMVNSKHTSPHVTSFVEADVTPLVNWRNKIKSEFIEKHGEKITFTPIFMEAVVRAIQDFPMINVSVDGSNIIVKKEINIGMAAALPSGNLIVPVIKNADYLSLVGLTKSVNDLANRARNNKLKPDEIQGGTFTLTNVGTFGNVMGTPIINQPQVAILATGAIRKKPAVLETEDGDVIAIRHMMFLSLSYDHRVVDGFLGGSFLRRIADYLEAFDTNQKI